MVVVVVVGVVCIVVVLGVVVVEVDGTAEVVVDAEVTGGAIGHSFSRSSSASTHACACVSCSMGVAASAPVRSISDMTASRHTQNQPL